MKDNKTEKRIMRRRGRPCKLETNCSPIRKPRAIRLSDEEEQYIADNAQKCRMNFSEYCRKVLMNYKPSVPDPQFRDNLIAARKDIVNFINFIRRKKLDPEERKKFLEQLPTIKTWWKSLFVEIKFIDQQMGRM